MTRHDDTRTPPVEVVEEAWRPASAAVRASLLQLLFGPLDGAQNVAPMVGVGTPRPHDGATAALTVVQGSGVGL